MSTSEPTYAELRALCDQLLSVVAGFHDIHPCPDCGVGQHSHAPDCFALVPTERAWWLRGETFDEDFDPGWGGDAPDGPKDPAAVEGYVVDALGPMG